MSRFAPAKASLAPTVTNRVPLASASTRNPRTLPTAGGAGAIANEAEPGSAAARQAWLRNSVRARARKAPSKDRCFADIVGLMSGRASGETDPLGARSADGTTDAATPAPARI